MALAVQFSDRVGATPGTNNVRKFFGPLVVGDSHVKSGSVSSFSGLTINYSTYDVVINSQDGSAAQDIQVTSGAYAVTGSPGSGTDVYVYVSTSGSFSQSSPVAHGSAQPATPTGVICLWMAYIQTAGTINSVTPIAPTSAQIKTSSVAATSRATISGFSWDSTKSLDDQITQLASNLSTLSGTVTTNTSNIASNTASISSLTTTVSSHTTSITGLNSSVSSLNSTVGALGTTYLKIDGSNWPGTLVAGSTDLTVHSLYASAGVTIGSSGSLIRKVDRVVLSVGTTLNIAGQSSTAITVTSGFTDGDPVILGMTYPVSGPLNFYTTIHGGVLYLNINNYSGSTLSIAAGNLFTFYVFHT